MTQNSENENEEFEFKYQIRYAHENENATDPKERHGEGIIEVTTDHEITGQADLIEIAKQIGRTYGYTKVGIQPDWVHQMVEGKSN